MRRLSPEPLVPWVLWSGTWEYAELAYSGGEAVVTATCQHDLAILEETHGGRYSDEDQRIQHSGDKIFEFLDDIIGKKLSWGNQQIGIGRSYPTGPQEDFRRYINEQR